MARKHLTTADAPRGTRGMRKLVICGQTWFWRFGSHIDIRDPAGRGHRVTVADLLGVTWDEVERASHKRHLRIAPKEIVDHIQRKIMGYDDAAGFPKGSPGHRFQAEVRKGWIAFDGPRGVWQAKAAPWIYEIRTPEDVHHDARESEILGMTIDAWMDIKQADLAAEGRTFDDLWRDERSKPEDGRRNRVEVTMRYHAPSMPQATPEQLSHYVTHRIVGRAALALAAA